MKRVQPDIGEILRNEFIGNLKTNRSLLRLWGTQTVNGIEIFTPRQYYHTASDRSANFEKLFKFLGAHEDVIKGNYDGVRKAWMYFNKNNAEADTLSVNYDNFIAGNLNKTWWNSADGVMPEGLTLTTSVVIEASNRSTVFQDRINEIINPNMPQSVAIASIQANYEELWGLCKITQEGIGIIYKGTTIDASNNIGVADEDDLTPDDPWLNTLARYALRSQGVPCTIKKVSIGTSRQYNEPYRQSLFTTYVVDIEIPYVEFLFNSAIVSRIAADLDTSGTVTGGNNISITKHEIKKMNSTDLEDDPNLVTRSYDLWENQVTPSAISNSLWFEFFGTWYLRAEPFRNPKAFGFTYKELNNYILRLIDSDYQKKSVPVWKKVVAAALVVIAIVVIILSVGKATGLAAKLLAAAVGILSASLTLTLLILAFSVLGMHEWATIFMKVSQIIEPLVLIATVVLIVTAFYTEVAKKVTEEQVVKTAAEGLGLNYTEKSVIDIALDVLKSRVTDFIGNIAKGAVDVFNGSFFTNVARAFTSKVFTLINMELDSRTRSLNERNVDLKAEYDKLKEESLRESDTLQAFARIYARPATADWSIFASTFDLPYERGGGFMSMGNIQKTTKQALRKADYTDPAFTGIMLI